MNLESIGFNDKVKQILSGLNQKNVHFGRVFRDAYHIYRILDGKEEITAVLSGRIKHQATAKSELPVVGDWVIFEKTEQGQNRIIQLIPRYSKIARKMVGDLTEEQVLAANVDTVFLVNGLDGELNLRRIERFVTLAKEGGVRPVILLNKSDVLQDPQAVFDAIDGVVPGVPVHTLSVHHKTGLNALQQYLGLGQTVALIGSSGVGKSSLINVLLNSNILETGEVHKTTSQGKHTTTRREMLFTPQGALLVDTPGLRELQIWAENNAIGKSFSDIEEIATNCRFRNCKHGEEPGCAVREAVDEGILDPVRVKSYLKQLEEASLLKLKKREIGLKKEKQKRLKSKAFTKSAKQKLLSDFSEEEG